MELHSLTTASIVVDSAPGAVPTNRAGPASTNRRQITLSVFHNVFFAYAASEVRAVLDPALIGEALERRADEVLLSAGWGTATWACPSRYHWQAPAFDLSDPDVPLFLERALVGGKLYVTRHAEKIGRYLHHAGGRELMDRFTSSVAVTHPDMAATVTRQWCR